MTRRLKLIPALIAAAGILAGAFAQGSVPMQTMQDSAKGNRLIINGKPIFASGMNIAWIAGNSFSNDVGDTPLNEFAFRQHIQNIRKAGGNAVRWWLHTDAANCPKINNDGEVTGIGTQTISNIRKALDIAYENGVVVSLCLFSFDLLNGEGENKTAAVVARNEKFLTVPANLDTYIEKGLKPILEAVGSHPAIMCWEVFNEPEGMSKGTTTTGSNWQGWASRIIDYDHVIRFTGKIAAEVHRSTKKMASTGIHEFHKTKYFHRYTDASLKTAAGGDELAYLDFYMAHYYPEYLGTDHSPFHNPASFWELGRPVVIGEFPARDWGPGTGYNMAQPGTAMTIINAYEYAYNNGYAGIMSWSMTEGNVAKFGNYETTKPALENLYAKHKSDIMIKDVNYEDLTGDLALKLVMANTPQEGTADNGGPWNELSVESGTHNFSGKTNFMFDMYIAPGSGTNLTIVPAIKVGSDWTWSPAQDESFTLAGKPQGQWFTVTIPVSAFGASSLSQVRGIILQYFAKDTPYTGTIYFDNVRVDTDVIDDFNKSTTEWSTAAAGVTMSLAQRPGSTSVFNGARPGRMASRTPAVTLTGRILSVSSPTDADMHIRLVDVKGKTVAKFRGAGDARFSIAGVPAGRYIVETRIAGKRVGNSAVIVK
ncbi:MAG: hypothetical protein FWC23_09330 [Chitinispirillia bacterium]|nr:hypothetical protein [Chitinispirillia bacterium]MCL2269370.1 hypothetical protein [Chitinispirillia bacterium]